MHNYFVTLCNQGNYKKHSAAAARYTVLHIVLLLKDAWIQYDSMTGMSVTGLSKVKVAVLLYRACFPIVIRNWASARQG